MKNTSANWRTYWDSESQTPFAVSGDKVLVYDNEQSVAEKIRFAMEKNLAGAMVWSIDTDDFLGACSESDDLVNFPIMRCINKSITQSLEDIKNAVLHGLSPSSSGNTRIINGFSILTALFIFYALV